MPLPQFLILLALIIVAAMLSVWAAWAVGVPLAVMGIGALIAAGVAHLATRPPSDRHHGNGHESGV